MSRNIKTLIVNSKDRVIGSSSNFSIKIPKITNPASIILKSCSIPNTIFNINSTNNEIHFNDGVNRIAVLTPGSYNIDTFLAEIKIAFETVSADIFTVTYSDISFRITIASSGVFSILVATTCLPSGFISTTGSAASHISAIAIDLSGIKNIYIQIQQIGNVCYNQNNRYSFVIAKTVLQGSIESFHNYKYQTAIIHDRQEIFNELDITLRDDDNNVLDLQGSEWSMVLGIEYC